ncbi:uncharacterized protein FOBCDRAFT_322576 [Fusarium oxysporum Fo47]|uniref:uncharacterized protein n=1 Tax=Fusarium oxysporum Fo47 TaxID=660027 RepID=UPI002869B2A7|nr:uncharacterized protein FOBCDRAFT_322576 [Fusarium oxysporum Fo47]WJG36095.1 hypothetical protein FOBCDRAFT_322576 [Fusarium oxysporum Fo47]
MNSKTLISVLACLSVGVSAGPCKPVTSQATQVTSTTGELSTSIDLATTVSESDAASTTELSSKTTEETNTEIATTTTAVDTTSEAPTTTTEEATTTTTGAAQCPTPSACNNLGFDWAYYSNPNQNTDTTYSSFVPESFKQDNPLYVGTTRQIGGLFQPSNGATTGPIYGSTQNFPLDYFALNHHGYLYSCDAGTYKFDIPYANDALYLWVGDKAYGQWSSGNAAAKALYNQPDHIAGSAHFEIDLPAGVYIPIRFVYGQAQYGGGFYFTVTAPNGQVLVGNDVTASPYIIIIVGAGPSGLLLALLLAQKNIPSVVLESWPHLDTRLRATQYGVPATRVFRRAGILDGIRKASIAKFPSICWRRVSDHEKLISLDLSLVEDDPDRMTILPLGEIIQILYQHCVEKGQGLIDVKFNHEVTNVGQDDKSAYVDVNIKDEGKKEKVRLTADYIVGCDGASSAVRRSLFGRDWPGHTLPYRFVVQNVYYDGFQKHNWDGGNYMVDNDHWGLIARRGKGGLWRVTYGDPVRGLTDEEYLARRPAHMKAMLPGHPDPDQYRIEQTNLYNIHNRCVESFKVGRIILAGDAAHVCNPMGGYGCMTAVLDVGGLADCFIGYYHGLADEDILDKYAKVRRDIFVKYVDPRSIKNLNRVATSDPQTVLETDKFFGILKDLQKDKRDMKAFLLKVSSIEYDFTKHYKSN